ncbi:MAG: helix-turn-helix transcriptional regulator [Chloroflexia bacterium]|nr:helix-turn-helix transcriptional regulator [Chloroflexia bacterium]
MADMANNSYRQYCPIAHALDVIGDRWSLLIARELFLEPKRFTDLREGMPRIGTNSLTDRLKTLERTGIISRRTLPPPAASTVYELTDRGRALEDVIVALARWGGPTLGSRSSEQTISANSVMLALRAIFSTAAERGLRGFYLVHVEEASFEETLGVRSGENGIEVSRVSAGSEGATMVTDVETIYAVASGNESMQEAVEFGRIQLNGEPEHRSHFLRAFDE